MCWNRSVVNWISKLARSCGVNSCQRGIVWTRGTGDWDGGGHSGEVGVVTLVFLHAGEMLLAPACQLQED